MTASMPIKRKLAFQWLGMTPEERFSANQPLDKFTLAKKLNIGRTVIKKWEGEYFAQMLGRDLHGPSEAEKQVEAVEVDFDPTSWLHETRRERYEAALAAAKDGNAQAMKLLAQLAEELVEKSEQRLIHELSGDEITRRNLEAEQDIQQWHRIRNRKNKRQRMEKVSREPPLLPD